MSEKNLNQMNSGRNEAIAMNIFSEFFAVDNLIKSNISQKLPSNMELSHFTVLNYFFHLKAEKTPAQLAKIFRVTKGAMTNTITKLEKKGYVHSRPDWEDGRKKLISISDSGILAREVAIRNIRPVFLNLVQNLSHEKLKSAMSVLREIRLHLSKMKITE